MSLEVTGIRTGESRKEEIMKEDRMEEHGQRHIGFELRSVNNLIRRNLDLRFAEAEVSEVTGMQGPIIGYLFRESSRRDVFQKDIEKQFNIRRSTASVMLQNMEQKGLIVREAVNHDARMKKLVLTAKAVECHMRIVQRLDEFNMVLENGITPHEKEDFLRILDKISDNLKQGLQ